MNTPVTEIESPGVAGRRRALYAGVAGVATVAGAGLAWWKWRLQDPVDGAIAGLWPLSFDTPSGTPLAMQSFQGKPLLINFWATWCPPCVEELPLIDGFYRQNASKKWQVVGLAIDQPSAVRSFLQRTPVSFPIGLAGLGGTELGKSLGNLSGGLPFTVVVGATGTILQRRMGRVRQEDLSLWATLT